jgi:signal transduction histidine kinase
MTVRSRGLSRSLLTGATDEDGRAPMEAVALRLFGLALLLPCIGVTFTTHPYPRLHGRDLVVLVSFVALVVSAVAAYPFQAGPVSTQRVVWPLIVAIVSTGVFATAQPHGIWIAALYYIAIIAAFRLERRAGLLILALDTVPYVTGYVVKGQPGGAVTVVFGVVPWFLVMRMLRYIGDQRDALDASRAAEARAAAVAERARLAREMHDVLAHSLSALALQLESTRLLAADHGADAEVTRAIDQAHQIAAAGLQETRQAIATLRGDALPGPDRIGVLADAFARQSGLPVAVAVRGEPRELAPDARLAVYRTVQEALTNVRRHAAASSVELELSYLPESTVLVVEDRAPAGTPPPTPVAVAVAVAGAGYGLTGMRERAELLGGELLARPTGSGFRVELRLPA